MEAEKPRGGGWRHLRQQLAHRRSSSSTTDLFLLLPDIVVTPETATGTFVLAKIWISSVEEPKFVPVIVISVEPSTVVGCIASAVAMNDSRKVKVRLLSIVGASLR